jgi:transcriptional regulator CtsR
MGFGVQILKGVCKIFKGSKAKQLLTVNNLLKNKPLLKFGEKSTVAKRFDLRIKPDIKMPANPETLHLKNPNIEITASGISNNVRTETEELGNISLRLAESYQEALDSSKKIISNIYKNNKISCRAKSANSIYSKIERAIKKKGLKIATDKEASKYVQDGIGGRIILKNLNKKDIISTLDNIKIDGKNLSKTEKNIMLKVFEGKSISNKEAKIIGKIQRRVKLALAEKQSAPVVKQTMFSALQDALDRKLITMEQIEKSNLNPEIIKEFKAAKNTEPMQITEINNYIGKDGIPYFTDSQIFQFKELQALTHEEFDILSRSEQGRLFPKSLTKLEKSAIKESGYTTAQINGKLRNGIVSEIQIRGTGTFGEVEHIAYDSRLAKNTLSSTYSEYQKAVKKLTNDEYKRYNKYLRACYNHYRNLELGLKSTKPTLPSEFPSILSEDSMRAFHKIDDKRQAQLLKDFTPHFEETNLSVAA